jgi:hypothetical protein
MTKYRHELSAILSATALIGGPLAVLGDVLERRAQAGSGLSPAEVRAAARLVDAARADAARLAPSALPRDWARDKARVSARASTLLKGGKAHPKPANRP